MFMKKSVFLGTIMSIAVLFGCVQKVSSQNVSTNGFHFQFEGSYAPFMTGWSSELNDNRGARKKVESNPTSAMKAALLYQINDFYFGGGLGVYNHQLQYTENGWGRLDNSTAMPIFARAGLLAPVGDFADGFLNADIGYMFGWGHLRNTFHFEMQVGTIINHIKFGLGILVTKPKTEPFLGVDVNHGFDVALGPVIGVHF